MTDATPAGSGDRPRILLLGSAAARPEGLERALARGGFGIIDTDLPDGRPRPDAVLVTLPDADERLTTLLAELAAEGLGGVPVLALLEATDRDAPARALGSGAADALGAPIHLPEVVARLHARIRRCARSRESSGRREAALLDVVGDVRRARRTDEALGAIVHRLVAELDLLSCALVLTPPGGREGRLLAEVERRGVRDIRIDLDRYPEVREAIRTGATVTVPDLHTHPLLADERRRWAAQNVNVEPHGVTAVPVQVGADIGAVLLLRTATDASLSPSEQAFAEAMARAAGRILEGPDPAADDGVPVIDPVTGCATYEAFDRGLHREFERARRYALAFSLVLLDLDRFGDLNARLGAEAGDRILAEIGATLRRELRAPDLVARYGGDEFALLLPETGLDGAREALARARRRVREAAGERDPADRPEVSAGIVSFPHPAVEQAGDLLALVEAALMRGKAQGVERVGIAE